MTEAIRSIVAFVREQWPQFEMEMGSRYCKRCMEVFDGYHCCPHAVLGECIDHGTQELTRAGCCPVCGTASVTGRRLLHQKGYRCAK